MGHWSRRENEAIVADYLAMLREEIAGVGYNKAKHNRALQAVLDQRSKQSVEWKHRNISAVLLEMGCQYISGYLPAYGYQQSLREVVEQRILADSQLRTLLENDAERGVAMPLVLDRELVEVAPPDGPGHRRAVADSAHPVHYVKPNFLEREARNRALGVAGEMLVLDAERARLSKSGRPELAEKVEHVAATRGDGDGYDILSFREDGRECLIEVKTTRYGQYTPFFVTENELRVSQERSDQYFLFRLFEFERSPKVFHLQGSISLNFALTPNSYRAQIA